ncbi:hypothetical protein BASA50_004488 [Batrachochytrium salamandrivorans]|uniref:AB hydrolase-1 domain-containing protein n=1 Tax=Batrachochytrium salamandrivorans TaxID=1357716 RepID=A0ABQ8FFC3_9FUNG|nr:hypothetical protein BASA60_005812 [Batrachochytrium salamandrivorans]KAH6597348.1 hypothetical protein BASA50_004488 [Batrachochytrium salamandrivorans]KAH6601323.1 hypothetical protein BASA61_002007 [Batrachochytrium salamandrivorans]KAH9266189.1 hypothetical protein BASA84_001233 [Batrachochytrium salamandrivorans]
MAAIAALLFSGTDLLEALIGSMQDTLHGPGLTNHSLQAVAMTWTQRQQEPLLASTVQTVWSIDRVDMSEGSDGNGGYAATTNSTSRMAVTAHLQPVSFLHRDDAVSVVNTAAAAVVDAYTKDSWATPTCNATHDGQWRPLLPSQPPMSMLQRHLSTAATALCPSPLATGVSTVLAPIQSVRSIRSIQSIRSIHSVPQAVVTGIVPTAAPTDTVIGTTIPIASTDIGVHIASSSETTSMARHLNTSVLWSQKILTWMDMCQLTCVSEGNSSDGIINSSSSASSSSSSSSSSTTSSSLYNNCKCESPFLQLPWLQLMAMAVLLFGLRQYWLRSPVRLQTPQRPVSIKRRNPITGTVEHIPLHLLVQSACPHLADPAMNVYHPHPLLSGGHLQTMYAAVYQRASHTTVAYDRELVNLPDGGVMSLDWHHPSSIQTVPPSSSSEPPPQPSSSSEPSPQLPKKKLPYVLILHGLTGGSHETYVQDLVTQVGDANLPSVVMNFRGCSGTPLTSAQLYSGAWTGDVAYCIRHIQNKLPGVVLFACGFSLGANVLTKYVGEMGDKCPLVGAASIGNPFDLLGGLRALHRSWIGKNIYSRAMTKNLSKLFLSHAHAFKDTDGLDIEGINNAVFMVDFDEACTRRAFNYHTVEEYYRQASSAQYIPSIAIPMLMLSACDDPVANFEVLPWRECLYNPHVVLATTSRGGHLGWFEASWSNFLLPGRRWFAKPVGEFIKAILEANLSLSEIESAENTNQSLLPNLALRGLPLGSSATVLNRPVTADELILTEVVKPTLMGSIVPICNEESVSPPDVVGSSLVASANPVKHQCPPATIRRVRLIECHVLKVKREVSLTSVKPVLEMAKRESLHVAQPAATLTSVLLKFLRGGGGQRVWTLLGVLVWLYVSRSARSGRGLK